MLRFRCLVPAALAGVALAAPARACPVCAGPTGREVRAGIFGADFVPNLLTAALPFPIVLGLAAALHFGFGPRGGRDA
jgi:hypothetical protein